MVAPAGQTHDVRNHRTVWCGGVALALLLAGAAMHLLDLTHPGALDLSGDEAHYWEWSRRLALSYYSKGPLVAYIIALSRAVLGEWSQHLVGNEALAVRVPAMLLSVITGLGLYILAVQTLRRPGLALAAVALVCTVPIFAVGSILMTIDAPLVCLYVWTLVAVERGLRRDGQWPWLIAGVLIALGILAKYTMVLIFPVVGLALLLEPGYRRVLRSAGPYLATLVGTLGFIPILVWNARHDWVSFRHVAGQAGVSGGHGLDPLGPLEMLAGQAAVIGPVWFSAMLVALVALCRKPVPETGAAHTASAVRFLCAAAAIPWCTFLAFSPITKVQPNWPALALPPAVILLVAWLARCRAAAHAGPRRAATLVVVAGVVLGSASVLVVHRSEWLMPAFAWLARGEPPWNLTPIARYDPSARLRGWSQLGAEVGAVLAEARAAGREPFLVTDDYQAASEIAFYCPAAPAVYCIQAALGNRQSQYDLWRPNPLADPSAFVGRPCIYVGTLKPELIGQVPSGHAAFRGAHLARTVEHRVRGYLLRVWPVYIADEFAGLPPELVHRTGKY